MESTEHFFGRLAFNAFHGLPSDSHFEFYDRSKAVQQQWITAARAVASHIADGISEQLDF